MFHGGVYTYVVTGSEVVEPADRHVLEHRRPDAGDPDAHHVHPQVLGVAAPHRLRHARRAGGGTVVAAVPGGSLLGRGAEWRSAGPLPGDVDADVTPTASATTVAATTTDAATLHVESPRPGSTEPPSTAPSTASSTASTTTTVPPTYTTVTPGSLYSVLAGGGTSGGASAAASPSASADDVFGSADAFDQGWFHDSGAIAPVIAWAAICIAVAAGAINSPSGGATASSASPLAVPFVIALYFFYENVDRLLPAAI